MCTFDNMLNQRVDWVAWDAIDGACTTSSGACRGGRTLINCITLLLSQQSLSLHREYMAERKRLLNQSQGRIRDICSSICAALKVFTRELMNSSELHGPSELQHELLEASWH